MVTTGVGRPAMTVSQWLRMEQLRKEAEKEEQRKKDLNRRYEDVQ